MNEVLKAGRQLFLREQLLENETQNLSYNQELVLGFNSLLAMEKGLIKSLQFFCNTNDSFF